MFIYIERERERERGREGEIYISYVYSELNQPT